MVRYVNEIRASSGKAPLRASGSLFQSSGRFARSLMRRDVFAHGQRVSVSGRFHSAGETLAIHTGWSPAVRRTVRAWMRSASHRAVLMSGRFRWIGVGKARGRFRGRLVTIWVAHLGG